ncbi:nucleotidyltransferase domain-containing protein [Paraburkholderia elongata]|uniref:Nucleotidyltransferase n=1 Tax=Paraburkholderia elongata TaxID=2675747 RepID=A0A972NJB1_9BURK|nr:nucleotidyltransferase [Paraburkholderia elongata]NPT54426.1 nucleotidyltransferase [Paraburkholderia elongata]
MKRDISLKERRKSVSLATSDNFFFLLDAIAEQQVPTLTQLGDIESSYQSIAEFLSARQEFESLITQIHPHGSREFGTMVRPWGQSREGFDIDVIARLDKSALERYGDARGPARLLAHFHAAFDDYANAHGLEVKKWNRCVTLIYSGGMCADIAPVIDSPLLSSPYGDTHGMIPDRGVAHYRSTNPLGYAKFFRETASIAATFHSMEVYAADSVHKADIVPLRNPDEVFAPLLCRIVQVLKLHRNVRFGPQDGEQDLKPSSAFITTLAAHAYAQHAPEVHVSPLDLLFDIVATMPSKFWSEETATGATWFLLNPAAPASNLAEDMNDPARQAAFYAWVEKFTEDLDEILQAVEQRAGIEVVIQRVEAAFGSKSADAARNALLKRQEAARNAGRASFFTSTVAPLTVKSRPHNFYGK